MYYLHKDDYGWPQLNTPVASLSHRAEAELLYVTHRTLWSGPCCLSDLISYQPPASSLCSSSVTSLHAFNMPSTEQIPPQGLCTFYLSAGMLFSKITKQHTPAIHLPLSAQIGCLKTFTNHSVWNISPHPSSYPPSHYLSIYVTYIYPRFEPLSSIPFCPSCTVHVFMYLYLLTLVCTYILHTCIPFICAKIPWNHVFHALHTPRSKPWLV